jgi:hypothetical protein
MDNKTIECSIRTPQFRNGGLDHFHFQSGFFDTETLWFTPYENIFNWILGHHKVHFNCIEDFERARTDNFKNAFTCIS